MKVKITNSDYRHKGRLIREGQTIDVDKGEYESNPDILIPVTEQSDTKIRKSAKSDNSNNRKSARSKNS